MEFLVQIQVNLPPDMDQQQRDGLLARERERGMDLRGSGVIRRIWRIPGRFANVGIWNAQDATSLHEYVSSLPLFPWLEVEVTALARHYLEEPYAD
jgi:muconolactone D-isomerase